VKILFVVMDRQLLCNVLFRCCLPLLPSLARRHQFAVALFADHLAKSCQAIRRSDVADSAVQSNVVVTFQGMFVMEVNDRLFLPLLEPPVTRNLAIVRVDLPIAFLPLVVLAGAEFCPSQQELAWNIRSFRPILHVVDDRISNIAGP
jgi:hypothetical protein